MGETAEAKTFTGITGSGTKSSPYQPTTPEHLLELLDSIKGIEENEPEGDTNGKYAGADEDGFTYIKLTTDIDFSKETYAKDDVNRLGVHHAICRRDQKIHIFSGELIDGEKAKESTEATETEKKNPAIIGLTVDSGVNDTAVYSAGAFFYDLCHLPTDNMGTGADDEQEGQLVAEHVDFLNCTYKPKDAPLWYVGTTGSNKWLAHYAAYYSNTIGKKTKVKMFGCNISLRVIRPKIDGVHVNMVDCSAVIKDEANDIETNSAHQQELQVLLINCNEYIELVSQDGALASDGLGSARIGCTTEVHGLLATDTEYNDSKNSSSVRRCVLFRAGPIIKSAFLLYVTHLGKKNDGGDNNDIGQVPIYVTGDYRQDGGTQFYCESCCFVIHVSTKYLMEGLEADVADHLKEDVQKKLEEEEKKLLEDTEPSEDANDPVQAPTDPHGHLHDPDFHENFDFQFMGHFVGISIVDVDILPTHAHLININFPSEEGQAAEQLTDQAEGKVLGLSTEEMKNAEKLKAYGFLP